MRNITLQFQKAEVTSYNMDNNSFDVKITYFSDGKQKQMTRHVTKEDRDFIEVAENILIATRRLEKNSQTFMIEDDNPFNSFVNVKIDNEECVAENIARFVTKVMNQARMNGSASSVPRYLIRDAICKLSSKL